MLRVANTSRFNHHGNGGSGDFRNLDPSPRREVPTDDCVDTFRFPEGVGSAPSNCVVETVSKKTAIMAPSFGRFSMDGSNRLDFSLSTKLGEGSERIWRFDLLRAKNKMGLHCVPMNTILAHRVRKRD